MDGVRLQKLIYAGYGKMAKKVGTNYDVYRSDTFIDPIDTSNLITRLPAFFSATQDFEAPSKFKIPDRFLWADGQLLRQFDFLVGAYGTFYVGAMQPNLPMQAVRTNSIINIDRPSYSISSTVTPELTRIATNVPAFLQLKRLEIKSPAFGVVGAGTAISQWYAFMPVIHNSIQQHDIVTDQSGIKYQIDAPDYTEIGYVASIRLLQV